MAPTRTISRARAEAAAAGSGLLATRRFRALEHRFALRTNVVALARHVEAMFGAMAAPCRRVRWYTFLDRGDAEGPRYLLTFEDRTIAESDRPGYVFQYLIWHVNQEVVRTSGRYLLFHAGGVTRGRDAVLLPAEMEAGKTTLVAGLLSRGFAYLTDEAVAVDPRTLLVHPFPKPLSIDPGSFQVLGALEPASDPELAEYLRGQWQVDPRTVGPGAVSGPAEARLVISPRYRPDEPTALTPLRAAEAVGLLADNCFNLRDHGRHGLEAIADLVRRADSYRLAVGDLATACELVAGVAQERT